MAKYDVDDTVCEMLDKYDYQKALVISSTYKSKSVGHKKMFWEKVYLKIKLLTLEKQVNGIKQQLEGLNDKQKQS